MEEMAVSKREERNAEGTGVLPRAEIVRDEHPLSLGKTSVWNQYFQVTLMRTNNCLPVGASKFVFYVTLKYHHLYCSI